MAIVRLSRKFKFKQIQVKQKMAVDRWQHHLNSLGLQSAVKCQAAVDEFENFCSSDGRAVVFESLYEFAVAQ